MPQSPHEIRLDLQITRRHQPKSPLHDLLHLPLRRPAPPRLLAHRPLHHLRPVLRVPHPRLPQHDPRVRVDRRIRTKTQTHENRRRPLRFRRQVQQYRRPRPLLLPPEPQSDLLPDRLPAQRRRPAIQHLRHHLRLRSHRPPKHLPLINPQDLRPPDSPPGVRVAHRRPTRQPQRIRQQITAHLRLVIIRLRSHLPRRHPNPEHHHHHPFLHRRSPFRTRGQYTQFAIPPPDRQLRPPEHAHPTGAHIAYSVPRIRCRGPISRRRVCSGTNFFGCKLLKHRVVG